MAARPALFVILLSMLSSGLSYSIMLSQHGPVRRATAHRARASSLRSLIVLPEVDAPEGIQIGVLQEGDIGPAASLLVQAFYPEMVMLGDSLSPFERSLLEQPIGWLNASIAAYLTESVRHFVKRRIGDERLSATSRSAALIVPKLRKGTTTSTSIALAAASETTGEVLGFVELSIRPLDGRVPTDLLDDGEALLRCLLPAGSMPPPCAYLCNLCVAPRARRRGIGASLVRACERIAGSEAWGHSEVYLHVGMHEAATARMYRSLGFEPLPEYDPKPWQVRWLGVPECTFYRSQLR